MKKTIKTKILMLLVFGQPASAVAQGEFRLLDPDAYLKLERAEFEVSRYMFRRDPYVQEMGGKDWFGLAAMEADIRLMPGLKWSNRWHTSGDYSAVRHVGWRFEIEMDYWKKIRPFYFHHSQHVMEYGRDSGEFPLEDRYGVKFLLYGDHHVN